MPDRDDLTPPDDESTATAFPPDRAPERIGPYKILEKIGEGGMGVVYLAEQDAPLRRRVALKIIKPGMDSKQVLARFEAERQALALMNHPGVAKVFDASSTPQGRPYFVMEHVPGVPITDYCDRHLLDNRSRMELFIKVCEAIQHAHQKGIIHRDIKPSNVLVALIDGAPHPKVIDFGVAKATQQHLTEETLFTQQGVLIGTPEYMSPEQAEMNALDIDARSDVYSLGVLLYELIAGALPFDSKELRQAGFDEIRRKIREDEPPRPSTRVSTLGDRAADSARRRRTDTRALVRQLHGDLDWIAMKCLEKDRIRRYSSTQDLALDLTRHLKCIPVVARPPSVPYRVGRLLKRRRRVVFAVIAAGTTALVVAAAVWAGFVWAEDRRQLRRLQWTLEQVDLRGVDPASLASDWDALHDRLRKESRSDPGGSLAELALRASCRIDARLSANFGLLESPPKITMTGTSVLDPCQETSTVARLEVAWDGGPWRSVGYAFWPSTHPQRGGAVVMSLSELFSPEHIRAGPHDLALRAYFEVFDGLILGTQVGSGDLPPRHEALSTLRGKQPRLQFERNLGSLTINLFAEYPEDFPRAMSATQLGGPISKWLRVDRVTVIRVRVPDGIGPVIQYSDGTITTTIPRRSVPSDFVSRVWFEGSFDQRLPIPIAAEGHVLIPGEKNPLITVPFSFATNPDAAGGGNPSVSMSFSPEVRSTPMKLPANIADQTVGGELQIVPSRAEARKVGRIDRFLDTPVSFPVAVTIRTVDARPGTLPEDADAMGERKVASRGE